jgi:uncharacterized protein
MTLSSPIKAQEREIFMDVLRGFAILGIFIANLGAGFSWYDENAHLSGTFLIPSWDSKMLFLHHWLIEGKFYSIFSLLFGWGIALQIKRAVDKGSDAIPTIKRRLFFMLLLGFCHLLIWTGDIVCFYAMLGFLLLPLRKYANKTLLITSAILILSPILLYGLKMLFPILTYPSRLLNGAGEVLELKFFPALVNAKSNTDYLNIVKNWNWWEVLKDNIAGIFYRYGYLVFISRISKVLGMFLIGFVIGRTNFYKNIAQYKKLIITVIIVGFTVGLPTNYALAHYMVTASSDYFQLKEKGLYQTIVYALGVAPLALAYVGLFMLAFKTSFGNRLMSGLAPVGKMAFSNYIMQSFVANFIFLGAGLGLMGQIGPVCYTLFGVVFFIIQIIYSNIWLRFFHFGPLEWLWRSATYKKWQPMRKS